MEKPKLVFNDNLPAYGRYYGHSIGKPYTNSIEINIHLANKSNLIKETIRHELIHAVLDKATVEEDICHLIAINFDNIINWGEEYYQLCLLELKEE